jgi:hypothetical protein
VPDDWTAEQAWCECERGDWMIWLAGRLNVERVAIVRTACAVARSVLHLVPPGEDRPRLAIEAAEAWCDDPSPARAEAAEAAAWAAAAAWCAAGAAWCAAGAAVWAEGAWAAASSRAAARAAVRARAAAAGAAANHRAIADVVRGALPWALLEERL